MSLLSKRSTTSLAQLLRLYAGHSVLKLVLSKHGICAEDAYLPSDVEGIRELIRAATADQQYAILDELVRTYRDFRSQAHTKYRFDERWDDLVLCLRLDGLELSQASIKRIEPIIPGVEPLEDYLSAELTSSGLPGREEIARLIESSANNFRRPVPNYNNCLSDMRTALETLGRNIAEVRRTNSASFDLTKWGQVLAYLRTSRLITAEEEKGIAGVYAFVSQGAHRPIRFSEAEMARLGRNLTLGIIYFLLKLANSGP